MKKFDEVDSDLLDKRIPKAFDEALRISRIAESTIYMIIAKCLEEYSDIELELESDNRVCNFFEKWNNQGYIYGALSYSQKDDGTNVLSCSFDLDEIKNTFESLSGDLFGSISVAEYTKKIDDSDLLPFNDYEIEAIEKGFQKVILPKKVTSKDED